MPNLILFLNFLSLKYQKCLLFTVLQGSYPFFLSGTIALCEINYTVSDISLHADRSGLL